MNNKLQVFDQEALEKTEDRVREMQESGEIDLPADYSPNNSLKSAWLELQRTTDKNNNPVLESCNRTSVMQSLLETIIMGLNPSKDQVAYIARGKTLYAQPSYFGNMHLAKTLANVKEVRANLFYEGDEIQLENENGRQKVVKHEQSFKRMQEKDITGAYAVLVFDDDRPDRYTVMTRDEIEAAWSQGHWNKSREDDPHNKFTGEMAKKTVINRACKSLVKSSNDSRLVQKAFDRANVEQAKEERDEEIEEVERETVDIPDEDVEESSSGLDESRDEDEPEF